MVDLGTLGGTVGFATALNNRGQVAGQSNLAGNQTAHPFLWSRGTLTDLGTLGGTFGTATWMNDAGEVVGGATTRADKAFHAFFWRKGTMTDLGTINGDTCSVAHFMNARGQVVGTSGDCEGQFEQHGFISQRGGRMIDLNRFVPKGSHLTVTDGETINDRGENRRIRNASQRQLPRCCPDPVQRRAGVPGRRPKRRHPAEHTSNRLATRGGRSTGMDPKRDGGQADSSLPAAASRSR
jgi:probable HAF family extracellular repeat protein